MIETICECPICKHDGFTNYLECKDHMLTKEVFTINKCNYCHFLFTNPRPDIHALPSYYKSSEYISHTDQSNNLISSIYKIVRTFTLKQKFKLISTLTLGQSILDFGCGTGDLLKECQKHNWDTYGFEPDAQARNIAQKKVNHDILFEPSQLERLNNIAIVTLWHVLEHVSDLNNTIALLKKVLSSEGKMVIAVPNPESHDANHYKEFWAAYDVPRHLYHFTQDSMQKLMQKHQLQIVNTMPMKLDSFYVSLLSEKYKNSSSNYIRSIINGCKSNYYAKKNNKNYSSLIYIVSK